MFFFYHCSMAEHDAPSASKRNMFFIFLGYPLIFNLTYKGAGINIWDEKKWVGVLPSKELESSTKKHGHFSGARRSLFP